MARVVGFIEGKKIECRNCGAKIEYYNNDVIKRFINFALTGYDDYYLIRCPNCNKEIEVPHT